MHVTAVTPRYFTPNLRTKRIWVPELKKFVTVKVTARALQTISKNGAHRLLDAFQGCFCSSDWMLTRLQLRGNSYCYFPWLIIQEGMDSTIRDDCSPDRDKVVRLLKEINYDLENYI